MRLSLCLEPVPTETVPTETVPTETVSTETVPTETTARLKGMEGKAWGGGGACRAFGALAPSEVMANINKVEKWVTGLGGWGKTTKL